MVREKKKKVGKRVKEGFKEGYEVVILKLYENGRGLEISKDAEIDVKEIEKMLNQ